MNISKASSLKQSISPEGTWSIYVNDDTVIKISPLDTISYLTKYCELTTANLQIPPTLISKATSSIKPEQENISSQSGKNILTQTETRGKIGLDALTSKQKKTLIGFVNDYIRTTTKSQDIISKEEIKELLVVEDVNLQDIVSVLKEANICSEVKNKYTLLIKA